MQERYNEFIDLLDDVLIPKATLTPEKFYLFKIRRAFNRFFVENAMGTSRNAFVEATQRAFQEAYDIHKSKVREGWEERARWRVPADKSAEWEALREVWSEEAAGFDTAESMEKWAVSLVPQVMTTYD